MMAHQPGLGSANESRRSASRFSSHSLARAATQDHQALEQLERDRGYDEQIDGRDPSKVFQPWDGDRRRWTIYLPTVDSATSMPSINNSPWIRGAPHSGFSRLIRRISALSSESVLGRPPTWRDFQRQ